VKKKDAEDPMEKLVKLTKLMKQENVRVAPKGPPKASNKWRSGDPKFEAKAPKPLETVQGGGMDVDPALKEQYDNWRKDKDQEQQDRLAARARKAKATKERYAKIDAPPEIRP
jgi:hypothetical protein